jgi:AcrR family transcriptional regulator
MPKISEDEKDARRARILAGARRCFARHGYEGATVVKLEQEIGLSRGAIFNWFPSKDALFFELAAEDNDRLTSLYADEGFPALARRIAEEDPDWLAVYFEFLRRMRANEAFRSHWTERGSKEVRDKARARLEAAQAAGTVRSDISTEEAGTFLGLLLDGLVVRRALGFETPDAELVVRLADDALSPIGR